VYLFTAALRSVKETQSGKIYRIRKHGKQYVMKGKRPEIIVEIENQKDSAKRSDRFIIKVREKDRRFKRMKARKEEHKGKELRIGNWLFLYDSNGREVFAAPIESIYRQRFI